MRRRFPEGPPDKAKQLLLFVIHAFLLVGAGRMTARSSSGLFLAMRS